MLIQPKMKPRKYDSKRPSLHSLITIHPFEDLIRKKRIFWMNALFNHLHLKSFKCTFSISHICTIITLMPHNLEEFLVKKFLMSFTLHAQLLKIDKMHAFKSKQRFLIYQYIFNCDHSYKLKTGISSHLHGKVANGPQHWGTRAAKCWLFSSQEAAGCILELLEAPK